MLGTPTYDTCASKHSRVRQIVNHIQFKTIALKSVQDEFDLLTSSTCLVAHNHRSRKRPTVFLGTCKDSTDEKLDMKLNLKTVEVSSRAIETVGLKKFIGNE